MTTNPMRINLLIKKIRGHAKRLTMGILFTDWPCMQKDIAQTLWEMIQTTDKGDMQRGWIWRFYLRIGRNNKGVLLNTL